MKLKLGSDEKVVISLCLYAVAVTLLLFWSLCINSSINGQLEKEKELLTVEKQKNEEFAKQLDELNEKMEELSNQLPK